MITTDSHLRRRRCTAARHVLALTLLGAFTWWVIWAPAVTFGIPKGWVLLSLSDTHGIDERDLLMAPIAFVAIMLLLPRRRNIARRKAPR